jgi:hypothetical protein
MAVAIALSAVLGACGSSGGDDDAPPAPSPGTGSDVPSSALESVAGLLAYVNELIAGTSETSEPVRVGDVTLPVSDTTEPVN